MTKIHDLVLADHRLKVREIAELVGISKDCVAHILHETLGMRKLSTRWVPGFLTPDNKQSSVWRCLSEFLRRYVIFDETWNHWYTPETKEQSKQWTLPGEPDPKKAKTAPSAGKVIATIFWNSQGVICIDYLEKGKMVTGQYYVELLGRLDTQLKRKRPYLAARKVLFHHDNAQAHTPPHSPLLN